jgi:hypothetical protein
MSDKRSEHGKVRRARHAPPGPEDHPEHHWLDDDAGPVVRPYTVTGGRARPATGALGLQPEHRAILSLTRRAQSVAEIAGQLDLPIGVVRVLVGDLLEANLVSTFDSDNSLNPPDEHTLQAVIDGLRAL